MKHGTTTGYRWHGCRCDPCRAASRLYEQRRRNTVGRTEPFTGPAPKAQPPLEAITLEEYRRNRDAAPTVHIIKGHQ